ncbi:MULTISPECIES: LacI family DNA-binding transcriptional regulator [Pseudomonas]|uniref:LacI family transcriptional regulator n=5 Tax=Pseudomonas viridiflava TaxID=33069 RepID=A0A1Y6JQR4_PSEVI|nr:MULTISPECIES: LacI family DNA-binding transcriptional regulator [Pseudomonas]KTC12974.1 transcriptional regulator [Pseudomonas marginalis ICMP 11289]MCF8979845.1 LacI family DNA-binding transcriptional regulator [Pseudomonas syringae]VVN16615.1 HTH-type transcriptional repressor CytR [Pseudomonas fluorescens]MBI6683175.1 LacI family DNA-binding transcriptional regulator [Pseudomonas viridiflava]MEE4074749.1 LacI family DNA-binding transcriptional regulator [Pseudomonas viridiflava]
MQSKVKRITIKDVAQAAGVSFQTVSLVINHPEKVAKRTLAKVQDVIRELNFVPSVAARSLRNIPIKTVACIFFGERAAYDNRSPQIQDTYWNSVIQSLGLAADEVGYSLLQRKPSAHQAPAVEEILELYRSGSIVGIVAVVEQPDHPVLIELSRNNVPIVLFGTIDPNFMYVAQANRLATAQLVDHLHSVGCRKIAFIAGEREGHTNQDIDERYLGYQEGVSKHNLLVNEHWNIAGDWSMASGLRVAQQLCAGITRPDAMIFASDRMALGALKGLYDLGLRVPHDICVVGFDNMQYDDFSIPTLTSVDSPLFEMATTAIELLLKTLTGLSVNDSAQMIFPAKIIIRDSTRRLIG